MSDSVTKEEGSAPDVQSTEEPVATKKDTVQYETYQRTVSEAKKAKEKARELEEQVAAFQKAESERQEKQLMDEKNYQQLLKNREEELAKVAQERDQLKGSITQAFKRDAILSGLDGKVPEKFHHILPLDKVALDPQTMQVDQMSVSAAIEEFKKEFPECIIATSAPKLPTDKPQGSASATTSKDGTEGLTAEQRARKIAEDLIALN